MKTYNKYRFIIAAGGTGGHLFPAIAVAQKIKEKMPESSILFTGTSEKLESRVVPQYGFEFKPIWISGFNRKDMMKNLLFPVKVLVGFFQSFALCFRYKPHAVISGGAYVAGPVSSAGSVMGAKIFLLEQNSYPGLTNRLLEKKASKIFTSFDITGDYFREKEKIIVSGNPLRLNMELKDKAESRKELGLDPDKKTLLILGGSLGARSINNAVAANINKIVDDGIQVLWQCGKLYYDEFKKFESDTVKVTAFIEDMSAAYSAADLVAARAGATTIAEISYLNIPAVLIPSPNVAEDHQYKNARTLLENDAAILLEDTEAKEKIGEKIINVINNEELLKEIKKNISGFYRENASERIVDEIVKVLENRN